MIVDDRDPHYVDKLQEEINKDVNATIKLILLELERLAGLPPEVANEPVTFNRTRHAVIRRVWTLVKECIQYGAATVQRNEPQ